MKSMRIVGLCLVAVFAFSALAAASASAAEPTYKTCIKAAKVGKTTPTGEFSDKNCSVAAAGGKYQLADFSHAKKLAFKGKNGKSVLDSYIPENEAEPWTGGTVVGTVECKSGKSVGEITGPSTSTVKVEFKTCTSEGKKCTSAGAKAGTIKTEQLNAILGNTSEGIGQDVFAPGGVSAAFNCEGQGIVTVGDVIGIVTGNVGKFSKESTQTFEVNAKGGQQEPFGEFGGKSGLHILLSELTPPGITLPSGEKTVSVLKGENMEIV